MRSQLWSVWLWFWLSLMVIGVIYTHGVGRVLFIMAVVISIGSIVKDMS